MKKRTAFICAILSLIPLGQSLFFKIGVVLSSSAVILSLPDKVYAESANFYFNRAYDKNEKGDYYGAISDYTKAIEINPTYADAYYNRGNIKGRELKDNQSALLDFNKSLEIDPSNDQAYISRGVIKRRLGNIYGALSDYYKAIEIMQQNPQAFINISVVKEELGDIQGACFDAKKAVSLGNKDSINIDWIKDNC